jgi:hypothetical protein
MNSKTVTFDGAPRYADRGFALEDGVRVLRALGAAFVSTLINGIGAVVFVGVLGVIVLLVAAWMVHACLVGNGHIYSPARSGPGTLTLGYDPNATGSVSSVRKGEAQAPIKTAADFYARYVVAVPQSRVASTTVAPASVQIARLSPAATVNAVAPPNVIVPRAAPVISSLAGPVPLPHERPGVLKEVSPRPEIAAAPAPEPIEKLAALAPTPPPAAVEKRAAPKEARGNIAMDPDAGARTAVYDIAAATVFMPDGQKLEAHSGLYDKRDDPRYVKVRMRGPTPPNVYDLTLREKLFHGVRAIRLNPRDEAAMHGRDGMLAHTYMLGPNGQSNGCVSFKDYRKFLQAFLDGKVDRLVVVPSLGNTSWRTAARQGGLRSGPVRHYASRLGGGDDEPRTTGALGYAPEERNAGTW